MNIIFAAHPLGMLKAYPNLLLKQLTDKDDNQLLYFSSLSSRPNNNPTEVFVGGEALHCISQWIAEIPANPGRTLDTTELAKEFQTATGVSIDLFREIPCSVFPADHPFRSTEGIRFLQEYQDTLALKTRLEKPTPVYFSKYAASYQQVILDSSKPSRSVPTIPNLTRYYRKETQLGDLLQHFLPGTRAAYDAQGNFWISIQTLFGLLTGEFTLGQYWCDPDHFTYQLGQIPPCLVKSATETNQKLLALLQAEGLTAKQANLPQGRGTFQTPSGVGQSCWSQPWLESTLFFATHLFQK